MKDNTYWQLPGWMKDTEFALIFNRSTIDLPMDSLPVHGPSGRPVMVFARVFLAWGMRFKSQII